MMIAVMVMSVIIIGALLALVSGLYGEGSAMS